MSFFFLAHPVYTRASVTNIIQFKNVLDFDQRLYKLYKVFIYQGWSDKYYTIQEWIRL